MYLDFDIFLTILYISSIFFSGIPESRILCPKCYHPTRSNLLSYHLYNDCDVEKPFKCNECSYRTKYKVKLRNHRFNRHERPKDAIGSYQCPNCSRKYFHKANLTRHQRLECGKEPKLNCLYCPYKSKHKSGLKSHYKFKHHTICNNI